MKQSNIYSYFAFGYNYRILRNASYKGYGHAKIKEILGNFVKRFDSLDLPVTKTAAQELLVLVKRLNAATPAADEMPAGLEALIKAELEAIDKTLDSELKLRKAYLLTRKNFALVDLLEKPEALLGAGTWDCLSEHAKEDFRLAALQIALSQPTGAAFHLMRALEDHVKTLYFSFKKTKRLKTPMWGPMTKELREKKNPRPTLKLLDHLDSMRKNYRNPTQHPEVFYTLEEAQDLLSSTIGALNMISKELR